MTNKIVYGRGAALKEGTGDHYFIKIKPTEHLRIMRRMQQLIEIDLQIQANPNGNDFSDAEVREWQQWMSGHCTVGRKGPQTVRDYLYGTWQQHTENPKKDFSTRQLPHIERIINWGREEHAQIRFQSDFDYQMQRRNTWERYFESTY